MERPVSYEQLEKYLRDMTTLVDANTFITKDFKPVKGSLSFLTSVIFPSFGKVHILTEGLDLQKVNKFLEKWAVSRSPFFCKEQVWDSQKSSVEVVKGICTELKRPSIYVTDSSDNAQSLLAETKVSTGIVLLGSASEQFSGRQRLFRFDNKDADFSFLKIFGLFYDPTFWQRIKPQ